MDIMHALGGARCCLNAGSSQALVELLCSPRVNGRARVGEVRADGQDDLFLLDIVYG